MLGRSSFVSLAVSASTLRLPSSAADRWRLRPERDEPEPCDEAETVVVCDDSSLTSEFSRRTSGRNGGLAEDGELSSAGRFLRSGNR